MASGDIILHSPLCPSCLNDPTTVNSVNDERAAGLLRPGRDRAPWCAVPKEVRKEKEREEKQREE